MKETSIFWKIWYKWMFCVIKSNIKTLSIAINSDTIITEYDTKTFLA
jgi:hypothetical protein